MIRSEELSEQAPRSASWLKIESVQDGATFAALRPEWSALLEQSRAGIFNAWEWLYPWYRRIGADRRLMILAARDERSALVGLMPLGLAPVWAAGRRLWRLSWLGETHVGSDHLDVIAREGTEDQVTRAFVAALRDAQAGWDVLDLVDVDRGSPTRACLEEIFGPDRFEVRISERYRCPFQALVPGEPFDDFLRRTGRRDNYLRRRRWLERQPGYRIEVTVDPAALAGPMADFFRLHSLRWEAEGGSQGIKGPGVEGFHRDAAQYLAERGKLRLYTLRLGSEALASVYGIVHRGRFSYFQSGYDPRWRSRSVGLVLVGETFQDGLAAGLTGYDFLRGTESYKSDWTDQQLETVAIRIVPRGGKGRWLTRQEEAARGAREVLKGAIPSAWTERIRRWRRRRAAVC